MSPDDGAIGQALAAAFAAVAAAASWFGALQNERRPAGPTEPVARQYKQEIEEQFKVRNQLGVDSVLYLALSPQWVSASCFQARAAFGVGPDVYPIRPPTIPPHITPQEAAFNLRPL